MPEVEASYKTAGWKDRVPKKENGVRTILEKIAKEIATGFNVLNKARINGKLTTLRTSSVFPHLEFYSKFIDYVQSQFTEHRFDWMHELRVMITKVYETKKPEYIITSEKIVGIICALVPDRTKEPDAPHILLKIYDVCTFLNKNYDVSGRGYSYPLVAAALNELTPPVVRKARSAAHKVDARNTLLLLKRLSKQPLPHNPNAHMLDTADVSESIISRLRRTP